MDRTPAYVVIHGRISLPLVTAEDIAKYVSGISYGEPSVRAVRVGEDHFVAIAEFDHPAQARTTLDRMGSFTYGASYALDKSVALGEFGAWAYHYSPPRRTIPA